MTKFEEASNTFVFRLFTSIAIGVIFIVYMGFYYGAPEKPAVVIPDYKDEIAELAFSLQEIKRHINKEHDLKAEMRMECSERLNSMVLQAEKLRRTVPNYKLED